MTQDTRSREAKNAIRFLRDEIDAIDLQLVALLVQRARLAVRIGEIKEYASLPVVEPDREATVLARVEKLRSPPLDADGLESIFSSIMLTMRRLQRPAGEGADARTAFSEPAATRKKAREPRAKAR